MRQRRTAWFAMTAIVCGVAILDLHAGGLLDKLPPDGHWAEYALRQTKTRGADERTRQVGHVRISSVGRVTHEGESCRWLELRGAYANPDQPAEVLKLLIPEKHLRGDGEILKHVVRGWHKRGEREVAPVDAELRGFFGSPVAFFLRVPLQEIETESKETITVNRLGSFSCTVDSAFGDLSLPRRRQEYTRPRFKRWRHSDAPFGTVRLRFEIERTINDRKERLVVEAELVATGTDAKSQLPENR